MPTLKRCPLLLAGLLTLLMAVPSLPAGLHLAGTFGNVHAFPWDKLCPVRWLCLAFVLGNGLASGDFGWISRYGVVRALVVLGAHAVLGLISLAGLTVLDQPADPVSPALHRLAVLMVVGIPLVLTGLLATRARTRDPVVTPSLAWRITLASCVLAGGLTGVMLTRRELAVRQQIRWELREYHAERNARVRRGLAELARLRPDDPLGRWLPFARADTMEVSSEAIEAIRARPQLTAELAGLLRGTDEPDRTAALRFLGFNARALTPELIGPVQDALEETAASMSARIAADPALPADTFDEDCLAAANLALASPEHAADFIDLIRQMRAALDKLPAAPTRSGGETALDAWLQQNGAAVPR